MRHYTPAVIENPVAYENAKQARIKHNAFKTRQRKLHATLADEIELLAWLERAPTPAEIEACTEQRRKDIEAGVCVKWEEQYGGYGCKRHPDGDCPADVLYNQLRAAREKAIGFPPRFIIESLEQWGGLTDKQLELARSIFAERQGKATERAAQRAAEKAQAEPWTAGRQVVEGVVVSIKSVPNRFGGYGAPEMVYKMTVKTDRFQMLYCSLPSSLKHVEKGQRVRFTVTVEPKQDDPTFAFGTRPTKGEILTSTQES